MIWNGYDLESFPEGSFTIHGAWPGELMGKNKDGSDKGYALYKPGDVFVAQKNGVLKKMEDLEAFIRKGKQG
jgi:hypothetical protein